MKENRVAVHFRSREFLIKYWERLPRIIKISGEKYFYPVILPGVGQKHLIYNEENT